MKKINLANIKTRIVTFCPNNKYKKYYGSQLVTDGTMSELLDTVKEKSKRFPEAHILLVKGKKVIDVFNSGERIDTAEFKKYKKLNVNRLMSFNNKVKLSQDDLVDLLKEEELWVVGYRDPELIYPNEYRFVDPELATEKAKKLSLENPSLRTYLVRTNKSRRIYLNGEIIVDFPNFRPTYPGFRTLREKASAEIWSTLN